MPDHLNVFEPYERKGPTHEDALTRAFLLVLRGVPVAHAVWLDLVDQAHRANEGSGVPRLHELASPQVYMQTGSVPEGVTKLISLVQTDEHVAVPQDAEPSDRGQVLDGIVAYDKFAIVIENKPWHGHIWNKQLHVNVEDGVNHDSHVACVPWKDIVVAWSNVLEANHLGTAETIFVNDFLDYIEEHFPALRPYSRVKLCGDDTERLDRRCKAVLEEIAGQENVNWHPGWGWFIQLDEGQTAKQVGFFPRHRCDRLGLVLEFDPADTGTQAKLLYDSVEYEDIGKLLEGERWSGFSNFHLGKAVTGFFHQQGTLPLEAYWRVWADEPHSIRRWNRADYEDAFAFLREHEVLGPEHESEWHEVTTNTGRQSIDFRPGITLQWRLPVEEAAMMDERGELERIVEVAIEEAAAVLRLSLPWRTLQPDGG